MAKAKFAEWLNAELDNRDWSQSDLARAAGLGRGTISNVLNNVRQPGTEICTGIAAAFNLPPEFVFRKAGLLPPKKDEDPGFEEWKILLDNLDETDRQELLEFARLKLKLQEERKEKRAKGKGSLRTSES